jgi:PleD family two-component response regulator
MAESKILAVLDDLLFTVKIGDVAKRAGLIVEFPKSEHDIIEKARLNPLLIIIDLNSHFVQPISLIQKLKSNGDTQSVSILGYVSHVQAELKQKAQEAGCDIVLARSAFSQNLPLILKGQLSET